MKKIKYVLFIIALILFTGCSKSASNVKPISERSIIGGEDNSKFVEHDKIKMVYDEVIAYAYFNEDSELIEVTKQYKTAENDEFREVVYITKGGFHAQSFYTGEISCKRKAWGIDYSGDNCFSIFSKTNMADAILRNSVIAIGSLGFKTLYGAKYTIKTFDYETFYKVIEENGLIEKREQLLANK